MAVGGCLVLSVPEGNSLGRVYSLLSDINGYPLGEEPLEINQQPKEDGNVILEVMIKEGKSWRVGDIFGEIVGGVKDIAKIKKYSLA